MRKIRTKNWTKNWECSLTNKSWDQEIILMETLNLFGKCSGPTPGSFLKKHFRRVQENRHSAQNHIQFAGCKESILPVIWLF